MKRLNLVQLVVAFLVFAMATTSTVFAQDITEMSLEDLLNVTVTSAGGREQKKSDVSQSMYVITKEDIARSGAKNVPDLFYGVPGMQVRRLDGHRYFVGVRGQPTFATNNLLVLIDGTIVFNPGFSGTWWNMLPTVMDEIERIEIIRGPGGVLYSSNAVNGVINIITKAATEEDNYTSLSGGTQTYMQSVMAGGLQRGKLSVRGSYDYRADQGFNKIIQDANLGSTTRNVDNGSKDHQGGVKLQYDFDEDMKRDDIRMENFVPWEAVAVNSVTVA